MAKHMHAGTWRDPWFWVAMVLLCALVVPPVVILCPWVKSESAAQAVGSVVALAMAVWLARKQHLSAMRAIKRQGELQAHEAGRVVLELVRATVDRVTSTNEKLDTLAKLRARARRGGQAFEVRETASLVRVLEAVQLQLLPAELVVLVMSVTSSLRQHTENVSQAFDRAAAETEESF
jgi:hypothetical protein